MFLGAGVVIVRPKATTGLLPLLYYLVRDECIATSLSVELETSGVLEPFR